MKAKQAREWEHREPAEEYFRVAVESAPSAMVLVNQDGKIVLINAQTEKLFGYRREELLGQFVEILVPESFRKIHPGLRENFFADPRARSMGAGRDLYARRKDGEQFPVEIGLNPIETKEGTWVLSSIVDITERKQAEEYRRQANEQLEDRVEQRTQELSAAVTAVQAEAQERLAAEQALHQSDARLQETSERLTNVLESITDSFIAMDRNWRCTYLNRKAGELLRHAGSELVGKVIWDILPVTLGRSSEAELNHAMKEHVPVRFQSYAEALQRWFDTDVFPTSEGVAVFSRDVTERKRFDEQLRQTQKLESLGILAGGVAHDFNNLLVGILGNSSLAADALPIAHPARAMLEEVVTAAERAAGLTQQLLAYAGKGKFVVEPIDLSSLVKQITMLVQSSIPRTVQLRLDLAQGLPPIEADAGQMQQLLMNLVINGSEAIGDRPGTVTVATGRIDVDEPYLRMMLLQTEITPGPYVFAEVQDTGIGMDEQTIAKIFDPFFTTKFTGRGLGLAAALGIVRGHKGAMKVYSTPGQGTTFKLLFPAALGKTTPPKNVAADQDLRGQGCVLVVDDEETVRRTAKNTLERYRYSVVLAENGQQALELLRQSPLAFDLVLLDLTMPVLSGEDTLREIRKIHPTLPVILSSGFNEVEAIRRFQGQGVSGFVQKPYTAATLARSVKAALTEHFRAEGQ